MTLIDIDRIRSGDLSGLNLAASVRISDEQIETPEEALEAASRAPYMGKDIKGRKLQTDDCAAYIRKRGGSLVHLYEEPDTSAWKQRRVVLPDGKIGWRVVRPVFEAALEDLKRGVAPNGKPLDGLVVYDLDRLTRDNRHLEDCIDLVTHHNRVILDTTGTIDLMTENGRTMARFLVTVAHKSSADTSRRVTRKHHAMQQAGIPAGGARPFGYKKDKRTIEPKEAELIRQAVNDILDGATPAMVVNDWTQRGIVTTRGNNWAITTLKLLLRNPRICGLRARVNRQYNERTDTVGQTMEIVRDVSGQPVKGQWNQIITVDEWERLVAVIGKNRSVEIGKNSRVYWLTGIIRCGLCNRKLRGMKSAQRDNKNRDQFYYGCAAVSGGGCGGLSIAGMQVDGIIRELIFAKYEKEAAKRAADPRPVREWDGEAQLAKIFQDQKDAFAEWRKPEPHGITSSRYFAILAELEDEERRLNNEKRAWNARAQASTRRPVDIRANWPSYTLEQKRTHAAQVLSAVVVKPSEGRGGTYKDLSRYAKRLELFWHDPE
jgi:DNA invertase Pin-like site-specific DNA recombinase